MKVERRNPEGVSWGLSLGLASLVGKVCLCWGGLSAGSSRCELAVAT